jgi:isocitrate dehydrogenase
MRTLRPVRQAREPLPQPADKGIPIVIVPRQNSEDIQRRRDFRETFHDSKALTIKRKRR